jgi:hypothetical protein
MKIRKNWTGVLLLGALFGGMTGTVVACSDDKPTDPHAAMVTWLAQAEDNMTAGSAFVDSGDTDKALDEWHAAGIPPVDPADWKAATGHMEAAVDAIESSDITGAIDNASALQADMTRWAAEVEKVMPEVNAPDSWVQGQLNG